VETRGIGVKNQHIEVNVMKKATLKKIKLKKFKFGLR